MATPPDTGAGFNLPSPAIHQLEDARRRLSARAQYPLHPLPGPGEARHPALALSLPGQVDHCLGQLYRFAVIAGRSGEFRAMQFGFSLGRLRVLLGGAAEHEQLFEELAGAEKWADLAALAVEYCKVLGRPRPSWK